MADYELTQEDQARILNEEVKAFVEFSTAQLKDFCENGPPIPGRKTDPPGRFLSYMHDTLKTELMNVFDPDYLVKVKEGYALPPQQYVFYAADQGTPVAGPFPSPEEAMIAAQQMGRDTQLASLQLAMEKLMLEVMYELPQRDDVVEVVIDAAVVAGKRRPTLRKAGKTESNQDAA